MAYSLNPESMYMMPIHFGPMCGPRQGPDGRTFENKDTPKRTSIAVSFLTHTAQLEALLPPGFFRVRFSHRNVIYCRRWKRNVLNQIRQIER
jgi:hypothetical protein